MSVTTKWQLDTPALCLDLDLLEANVRRMAAFFADKPAALRPHTKTHKCPTIAWMQIEAGAIGVTCAKVGEAEVMARAGIRDILIANQVVGEDKIARLMGLAAHTDVMVAVEDPANARALAEAAAARGITLRVLLEVDVGMGRCGVAPGDPALALAREVCALDGLRFEGLMGYEGHAVMVPDMAERARVTEQSLATLIATRDLLVENGLPVAIVSGGGTGAAGPPDPADPTAEAHVTDTAGHAGPAIGGQDIACIGCQHDGPPLTAPGTSGNDTSVIP